MTILPITYLGSADYFAHLLDEKCVIDIGENWIRQTARNRLDILTANGPATLTIPVHGYGRNSDGGIKIATKDIRIDNSKNWQHRHWASIVSAYRSSPFFDHYRERFEPIFTARSWDFLCDLNLELLQIVLSVFKIPAPLISETYIEASAGDADFRGKKALRNVRPAPDYVQVFSDRFPFVPGLSVVDLLFCEGPAAAEYINVSSGRG